MLQLPVTIMINSRSILSPPPFYGFQPQLVTNIVNTTSLNGVDGVGDLPISFSPYLLLLSKFLFKAQPAKQAVTKYNTKLMMSIGMAKALATPNAICHRPHAHRTPRPMHQINQPAPPQM